MTPLERFSQLRPKNLCIQCLYPGAKGNHDGMCNSQYSCKHDSHRGFKKSKHVAVCEEHKNDPRNETLFNDYKIKFITNSKTEYRNFSKNWALSFHAGLYVGSCDNEELESSIYMLQTIQIEGKQFNVLYDSGCGDLVSRRGAVSTLEKMGRASREIPGPLTIIGVGNHKTVCEHGVYKLRIPLYDGKDINISGLCLNKVTQDFHIYNMHEVEKDIQKQYQAKGQNPENLRLPNSVGGRTDLMIGIKYLKYFPRQIFQLPSGLTI